MFLASLVSPRYYNSIFSSFPLSRNVFLCYASMLSKAKLIVSFVFLPGPKGDPGSPGGAGLRGDPGDVGPTGA